MTEPIAWTREDGIATLAIEHTPVRNALTPDVAKAAENALDASDPVECLVIRGSGEAFCAGGDLPGIVAGARGELSEDGFIQRLEAVDAVIARIDDFPAPTIAAVDGPAFGAGTALALACDLRVAREDASIGVGTHRFGLPAGAGISLLLPQAVGESTARGVLATGELLDAERAKELGLFDRVVPEEVFKARVDELAETLASRSSTVTRETDRLLRANRPRRLRATMAAERAARRRQFGTDAHLEGVEAFLEGDDHRPGDQ